MSAVQDYIDASDETETNAARIALSTTNALQRRETTLIQVVQSLTDYVNHDDATIRSKAVRYLSAVLAYLPQDFLSRQQLLVLSEFFSARAQDGGALAALVHLQGLSRFTDEMASSTMKAISENFQDLQTLPQSRRYEVYTLINLLMRDHRSALQRMGDAFLISIIHLVAGEKDPRNLMVIFSILYAVMLEWDVSRHAEEMFESVFCYFPITFRPPPNNPHGITAADLKERLRDCIAANSAFAPYALPKLIDKLDSTSSNVKRDVIHTITACAKSYGSTMISGYSITLWDCLKFELMSEEDKDVNTDALAALATITATLSTVDNSTASGSPLDRFLTAVIKDCKEYLEEPQQRQARSAAQILKGIGSSSPAAFSIVVKAVLPMIIKSYGDAANLSIKRVLLEALLHLLDAGIEHQESGPVSELASDTLLEPFKNQILAIMSQALMGTDNEEVSFRVLAARCLRRSCSYRHLFTESEVGLAVQYFNDLLLAPRVSGKQDLSSIAAKALREISQTRPSLILDITFPTLLAQLPTSSTEENTSYLCALEALSQISVDRRTSDTLLRRLLARLETLIVPAENPQYSRAILMTLDHLLSHMNVKSTTPGDTYLLRVLGLVQRAATSTQSDNSLTTLNDVANIVVLGSVLCTLLKTADPLQQHAVVDQVYSLYCDRPLFVDVSLKSKTNVVQKSTIFLSTAILAGIDKKASLPFPPEDLPKLVDCLCELAFTESRPSIRHGLHQHLALLVNKFVTSVDLAKIHVVSWLVGERPFATPQLSDEVIQTICWVAKALVARLEFVQPTLIKLLELLKDKDYGSTVAHGFALLITPDSVMTKANGANIRLLARQKVLGICVPQVLDVFRAGDADTKVKCLVALAGLIVDVQDDLSLIDIQAVLPLLLQSLDLANFKVRRVTLRTLLAIFREKPEGLEEHLLSLISRFENVLGDQNAENADLRYMALECLRNMHFQFEEAKILPYRNQVMACISRSLDDPKRHVRKEAVDCRATWLALDQVDEV